MIKFFFKFLLIILAITFSAIIFLSYFGLETNRFDKIIKNRANEVNQNIKLEFRKTKIYLNPKQLNLVVKLQNPKILLKNNEIDLSKLDLFLSIKSFFSSDFLLKRAEIAFVKNDIKDLTKITNIFLPKIFNKQLKKIFKKGSLEGELIILFKTDGSLDKNYGFSGKISNALINITKEFSIKNLTTEIIHGEDVENKGFEIIIKKGSILDLKLEGSKVNLIRQEGEIKIKSLLQTNGKLDFNQIQKLSSLFGFQNIAFKDFKADLNLKTNINFNIDKRLKIKNLSYSVNGKLPNLEILTEDKRIIKKYLPEYDSKIIFKDTNIKFTNSKSDQILELEGLLKSNGKFDSFKINEKYNYIKKKFYINGNINLTNSKVKIAKLNYSKNYGKKSELNFDVNFVLNKYYNIKNLLFLEGKTKIYLTGLRLNEKFETDDFKKIEIKTFLDEIKNNDFIVNKIKKVVISGEVFDAQPLLKSLYKTSDDKLFSKKFKSEIQINFEKALTGTDDKVSDFAMIAFVNKGSYEKLSLKGNFSEKEIVEMSIYQIDKDKKTLQVISDRARPFIKSFDFIKGFEGGKLEYESIILKDRTNSNLTISNFKVSKVPALAKLLTLASLQGISDTLSGEGIRFEAFEMRTNSKGNVLNIEDAFAIGPAVSILLSGYVDKGKVVSLRGTLVPATKLNSIIASIPVVGDILVGKKTGEGVVGVSFKMKGPPKDIKTTVNPIKTLTPRFIVRAIEKMKKKKQEESK